MNYVDDNEMMMMMMMMTNSLSLEHKQQNTIIFIGRINESHR